MAAVLTRNPDAETDVVGPAKEDGSGYRFEMICEQGRTRAYADTATELVGALIPGYDDLPSEEARIEARVRYATGLLAPMQATVLQAHDQTNLDEAEKAVLFQPRFEPVTVEEWASEVPLVLLDVHYLPYGDLPAPVSALEDVADPRNLIWLRAGDDFALLLSLDKVGAIRLAENTDFLV